MTFSNQILLKISQKLAAYYSGAEVEKIARDYFTEWSFDEDCPVLRPNEDAVDYLNRLLSVIDAEKQFALLSDLLSEYKQPLDKDETIRPIYSELNREFLVILEARPEEEKRRVHEQGMAELADFLGNSSKP